MNDVRKALEVAADQIGELADNPHGLARAAVLAFLRAMPNTVDTTDGEITLDVYIPWTPSRLAAAIEKETT